MSNGGASTSVPRYFMHSKGSHDRVDLSAEEYLRPTVPPLMEHQKVAVEFLRGRDRAGLFLAMGTGKTRSVLEALEPRHLPALVIAPKRVAEHVWSEEVGKWRPDLSLEVAMGPAASRHATLVGSQDITVLGRDNLGDLANLGGRFKTVVLDELSSFKNKSTQRWKAAAKVCKTADHVWGLTGTPAPNGLMDLWAQVYLLDGGQRLGKTLTGFRSRYFMPGRMLPTGTVIEWILRPEAEKAIHTALEDLCLGMGTEGRVDLPGVTYSTVEVDLPPATAKSYKTFAKELVVDLDLLGGEVHSAANAAVLTSKLSQMTAGFLYVDDADLRNHEYDILHWEKVSALQEIIEDSQGQSVLVFYRFLAEKEMILSRVKGARTIDEPGVIDEWNRGKVPVLLAHPASAAHGLNLQYGGHIIVWTSQTWSLEEWEQGNGRLLRKGQTEPVQILVLRVPKSVDLLIEASVEHKALEQGSLLDHLESPL